MKDKKRINPAMKVPAVSLFSFFVLSSYHAAYYKRQDDFVNKKKDQIICFYTGEYSGSMRHYRLFAKGSDKPHKFTIPLTHLKTFEDSLKRQGWTSKIQYEVINKYKSDAELVSVTAQYISRGDTVYRFIYNLRLTYLKNNTTQTRQDTVWGFNKKKTMEAFTEASENLGRVFKVRGTTLLKTTFRTEAFNTCFEAYGTDTLDCYSRVFYF